MRERTQEHLGVRGRTKREPGPLELGVKLDIVVELAVEDDRRAALRERLIRALVEIDDRESAVQKVDVAAGGRGEPAMRRVIRTAASHQLERARDALVGELASS